MYKRLKLVLISDSIYMYNIERCFENNLIKQNNAS